MALLTRSIRTTTFDQATGPTARTVLDRADAMSAGLHGRAGESEGVTLLGDAGACELLAYVMRGVPGRVLIVDDTPLVRELLRDFLATVGHEVATAASGVDALEVVPVFQPDVILTDMAMPGMSGADLLDALRRAGVTVPMILISGTPITMPEGFFELLRKPFDLQKLAEAVTAALDHGRTERA